jgi:broad specificity phosphatase PhoE
MAVELVFETHSITEDNEAGCATGWNPGRLSQRGRELARELGQRRRDDGLSAVFASDLGRAAETARIAFEGRALPVLLDWRLRECNYGALNGAPVGEVHPRQSWLDQRYPGGETWRGAVARDRPFLRDITERWDGARLLVIGHMATYNGLEHFVNGRPLEALMGEKYEWQPGREYLLHQ